MSGPPPPLCLDVDGTLTAARPAHEQLLWFVKHAPRTLLSLLSGRGARRAAFWSAVATGSRIAVESLPYREELIDWLRAERAGGRRIVLLTNNDRRTAERIAEHLGIFDEVLDAQPLARDAATDWRAALLARFGSGGFDYVTANPTDEAVWSVARGTVVIGGSELAGQVARHSTVLRVFTPPRHSWRIWLRAMRLHQWVKNVLVFVPALLAHTFFSAAILREALLAFLAFGLCASSVYICNDLLDLDSDRRHFRKRRRPFAAATLSVRDGLTAAALLLIAAAAVALITGRTFAIALALYYALTWAYSLRLKRIALLDVMILAGLYTIRIIGGAAATGVALSFWLLAFSVFIFLSLGFVKRYAELEVAARSHRLVGHARGYGSDDLPVILSLGTASGYCSIVVIAVYINSADSMVLYRHHQALWLICPLLLFWISRIWMLTARGHMNDDPVVFALRDRVSLLLVLGLGVIVAIAI
jgi:4-hydroxybenzoate polyprenyltransferase